MSSWVHNIVSFLTDPLDAFHQQTVPLDQTHQDTVQKFQKTIQSLVSGPDGYQGPAADSMIELVSNYVSGETKLSGFPGSTGETISLASQASTVMATTIIAAEAPVEIGMESEAEDAIEAATAIITAAAQEGVDPISDGFAVWDVGKLAGKALLVVGTFVATLIGAYFVWKATMDGIANQARPNAESGYLFGKRKIRFRRTVKVSTDPLSKLFG
jgi:hypothetical protein